MGVRAGRKNTNTSQIPALIARVLKDRAYTVREEKSSGGRTGRPSVVTQAVVLKLELAFAFDSTVEEACVFAGISRNTFYEFTKAHPDFQDRITELRNAPVLMTRMCLVRACEHDANLALKYLERKRPEEFSTRAHLHVTSDYSDRHSISPEKQALIRKAMGNWVIKHQRDLAK